LNNKLPSLTCFMTPNSPLPAKYVNNFWRFKLLRIFLMTLYGNDTFVEMRPSVLKQRPWTYRTSGPVDRLSRALSIGCQATSPGSMPRACMTQQRSEPTDEEYSNRSKSHI
jgi:hypothetical protein